MNNPQKKPKSIKYLQDVMDLAGGATKLAAQLDLHAFTVENWRRCGIPQKYWDVLYKLYDLTPAELFTVSKACRARITRPSRVK